MAGTLVGRYELEFPLGQGAVGELWRGRDLATRQPVAVKLVQLANIDSVDGGPETEVTAGGSMIPIARTIHTPIPNGPCVTALPTTRPAAGQAVGYLLDRDYVIGREPLLDGDVAAGRAAALPITDAEGSVSRLHLRVSLVGWRFEVRDLGSANGSVLYRAGGSRTLAPADVVVLEPGARVDVGRRGVRFLPYDVALPSASPRSATPDGATE